MTAPRRSGTEQATIRGLVVLAVAVVIGIALLSRSASLVDSAAAGKSKPSSTTTTTLAPTTTPSTVVTANTGGGAGTETGTTHPVATVKVLVVNASLQSGVGSKNKDLLTTAGYNVIDVKNGPAQPTTIIYYAPGYQADATAIKGVVKTPNATVAALPATPIIPEASNANVTVALGKDYKG